MLITPSNLPLLAADAINDGFPIADWLHDNATQCDGCGRHYSDHYGDFEQDTRVARIGFYCLSCAADVRAR